MNSHSLHTFIQIKNLHPYSVSCILELSDKRIATCSRDGTLSICSIDFKNKNFIQEIKKELAHDDWIFTLCEISNNRLVCGTHDYSISIWKISKTDLIQIQLILDHTEDVCKIISLNKNKTIWVSCSADCTIKLWNNEEKCKEIKTLKENNPVNTMLLHSNNKLIASCDGYLSFWDLVSYKIDTKMDNVYTSCFNGLIELPVSGYIAVAQNKKPYSIVIINTINFTSIQEIKDEEFITRHSSLYIVNSNLFGYCYRGNVLLISNENYQVVSKHKLEDEKELHGFDGLIVVENKYILGNNNYNGIGIFEIE